MNIATKKSQKLILTLLVLLVPFLISPIQVQAAARATGGTYTESGGYGIHKFTSSGTFTPAESLTVEYLVVAGGGGGGQGAAGGAGGGGAGGYRTATGYNVTAKNYTITVGSGGGSSTNGSNSVFDTITSIGGGRGGNSSSTSGSAGGSGGGGGHNVGGGAGTAGQGYAGGSGQGSVVPFNAGGGGGAGAAGGHGGGVGRSSNISGSSIYYAGGGGGGNEGTYNNAGGNGGGGQGGKKWQSGTAGIANTGGGGGGAGGDTWNSGGAGGSGIVIIRYSLIPTAPTIATATALSTTSIRWNFTDNASNETGFKVYDTSNVLKATCASVNLSLCDEASLAANTSYTRKVVSYNGTGNSSYSSTASKYTLATTPTAPVVNNAGATTLDVNPNPNGSPTSTEMVVYKEAGASCDGSGGSYLAANGSDNSSTPVWQAESSWATVTATGLSEQTQYSFCTKSRNGDNVETSWGSAASGTTIETDAPSISSITSVAGDSSATYYDATDDSSTVIAFTSTDGAGGGVDNCKWDTSDVAYDSMSTSCGSTSSCTVTPSGEGVKTVYIRCQDIYANKMSSSQSVSYTIDSIVPSISSITSVAGDSSATYYDSTDDSSTAIVFSSTDGSGSGVSACKWDTTDTAYSSMSNSCASTSSCTSDLSGEGAKTIYIRCTDAAGNPMTSSQSVSYTIDATTPTTLSATGSSASWTNAKPTVTVSTPADALSGMNEIRYVWDSNDLGVDCSAGTTTTATANLTSTLTEGNHVLYLCASDNAGNVTTWNGAYKWDNGNPLVSIISHALGTYRAANVPVKIEGTASDVTSSIASVAVSIYNGVKYWSGAVFDSLSQMWLAATGTTTWEYTFTPVSDADYTLQSRSTDAASNTQASSTTDFTYDASSPVISVAENDTPGAAGATITWSTDEISSSQLEYGVSSSYGNTTSETDTAPRVTSHSVLLSSLQGCVRYHYRTISKDTAGNTLTGEDQTFTTTGCTGSSIIQTIAESTVATGSGGTVTLQESGNTKVTLTIPVNFSSTNADFQVKRLEKNSVILATMTPSADVEAIGDHVYQLDAVTSLTEKVSSFDEAITITMTYTAAQVVGYDESTLSIYRWDGSSWYVLDSCLVDTLTKTVTCTTSSFSTFILFGEGSAGAASSSVSSSSGNQVCSSAPPSVKTPLIYASSPTKDSVKLYFTDAGEPVDKYILKYGVEPGKYLFGSLDIGGYGQRTYVVDNLKENTDYYFRIAAINICGLAGEWSNEIVGSTKDIFKLTPVKSLFDDSIKKVREFELDESSDEEQSVDQIEEDLDTQNVEESEEASVFVGKSVSNKENVLVVILKKVDVFVDYLKDMVVRIFE